ncbi:MAG TPA: helix-hairpin-helix domain-containing protein [Steroidobacteraceae bacterium]|nr:helix-hairpin-helix domain-containing protein [Steroidobacteraceae bacterium]
MDEPRRHSLTSSPIRHAVIADRANAEIATRLEEVAQVLAEQGANPYRVNAYRRAAGTVRGWPYPVTRIALQRGIDGLMELPGVGTSLARSIYQLAASGRLPMLERLRGESDPLELLASVVGIGRKGAQRIHDELGIHSLEELEIAAHDGRLASLGVGEKRLAGIRDVLAGRLGRVGRRSAANGTPAPAIAEILDVDRQYREEAASGALTRIAPRRFNPTHEAWLPVLHTRRGVRHYTALFSNTARAHALGRTRDWVVLYFDGRASERQCTVITAERGPLRGLRIVRGREDECLRHHGRSGARAPVEHG